MPMYLPRGKTINGHFCFSQAEYAKDDADQDFRFALGGIDRVDFEVNLSSSKIRSCFLDR
jgi:hypothetical protein